MGIEETHYGIYLQCDKASHLGKKLFLPGLLDNMLYKLDMQDPQKNDCWTCQKKVRHYFRIPAPPEKLPDIRQDIEESDWQTANVAEKIFKFPTSLKSLPDLIGL